MYIHSINTICIDYLSIYLSIQIWYINICWLLLTEICLNQQLTILHPAAPEDHVFFEPPLMGPGPGQLSLWPSFMIYFTYVHLVLKKDCMKCLQCKKKYPLTSHIYTFALPCVSIVIGESPRAGWFIWNNPIKNRWFQRATPMTQDLHPVPCAFQEMTPGVHEPVQRHLHTHAEPGRCLSPWDKRMTSGIILWQMCWRYCL